MKSIVFLTSALLLIFACSKSMDFANDISTVVAKAECPALYGEILNIDNNRNLVYVFDPTCSVCQAEYVTFCKYAPQCRYDSLTTIVINSNDMLMADFYLDRENLHRPKHENVIYDTKSEISKTLYRLSEGRNVMLFENRKLIFSCNMQEYMFNDKK
jgi:hypothetical protein